MTINHQPAIRDAMQKPGFYPHPVEAITLRETHISTVFLTGRFVYKIKKPVDLGFLDFSSLEKRHAGCQQELILNRRLSSKVYLEILPITCQGNQYALNGSGKVVEFAVKMHQLPDSDAMSHRLSTGTFQEGLMTGLIQRLVDFYANAAVDRSAPGPEVPAWQDNLQHVDRLIGPDGRALFEFVKSASHAFFNRHAGLFQRRRQDGRIRDCHGDLRCDHIYFTQTGIQIIDCIEFSRTLRVLDVVCDLAFLAMDLTFRGRSDLARRLIREYIEASGDLGALPLLDFYCCYRAMVRLKVSLLRLCEKDVPRPERQIVQKTATETLTLARAYAGNFSRPILWIVCGLPASGKSTLAAALAEVWDLAVIRSDAVRKDLFAHRPAPADAVDGAAFERGIYSALSTEMTYREVLSMADETLKKGLSVIVDATFSRRMQRNQAMRLAEARRVAVVLVECRAAESVIAGRLRRREIEPSLSDARLIHLEAFKKRFAPIEPMGSARHIVVDTGQPVDVCLRRIMLADPLWNHLNQQGGAYV